MNGLKQKKGNKTTRYKRTKIKYGKELRLPVFRQAYKQQAIEAAKEQLDYETYLLRLMEKEYEMRLKNWKKV